jgi:hypothetical protein
VIFNGTGQVKGKIILNLSGTVCTITTIGAYGVSAGSLGAIGLPLFPHLFDCISTGAFHSQIIRYILGEAIQG